MNYENIKKRFDEAVKRKSNWETLYKDALRYVAPEREAFSNKSDGSSNKRDPLEIYDSTASTALNKFVSNIQSSLVPPMKRWTKLVAGEGIKQNRKGVSDKLDELTGILFSCIQNSNFDTQVAEAFCDLAIGTGALMCIKGDSEQTPLRFICVPLNELYLEEGPHGRLETVFRKHEIEVRNVSRTWDDVKIPTALQNLIDKEPSKKETFIECTYPSKIKSRTLVQDPVTGKSSMEDIEKNGFTYVVLYEPTKDIIVKREQVSSPWIIFRWSVFPGEIYGRGPVLFSLPDIKTLNKTKELILKRASIDAVGMFTVEEDGVINLENVQISPGALIPVMKNPGGMTSPTLSPLPMPGGFNVAQIVINDLKTNINEVMFADPLGPIDLPVKTATEIAYRQQELAKRIGSSFGRLQQEFITPLINRVLFLIYEWGLTPEFGEEIQIDGVFLNTKHESPLSSAQDQENVMAIQQFVQFLASVFGPQMLPVLVQSEKVVQYMAKYLNIPSEIQLDEKQLEAVKQKIAQMGQMAEQAMQNQTPNTN